MLCYSICSEQRSMNIREESKFKSILDSLGKEWKSLLMIYEKELGRMSKFSGQQYSSLETTTLKLKMICTVVIYLYCLITFR